MRCLRLYSLVTFVLLLGLLSVHVRAQSSPNPSSSSAAGSQNATPAGVQQDARSSAPAAAVPTANATSSRPALNAHAQRILSDTDKLVDLVQQLQTEMEKTNQDVLSLGTIHRAEDIEKLAKELEKQLEHARK
jgi:hypothetical protein